MSKFLRGDLVTLLVGQPFATGQVILTWSGRISARTGIPLVEVLLDKDNVIAYFDEDELALTMHEYEFAAVAVDLEDSEQAHIGSDKWVTLEEAEKRIQSALADGFYTDHKQLQINRRRKAGFTIGFQAYGW